MSLVKGKIYSKLKRSQSPLLGDYLVVVQRLKLQWLNKMLLRSNKPKVSTHLIMCYATRAEELIDSLGVKFRNSGCLLRSLSDTKSQEKLQGKSNYQERVPIENATKLSTPNRNRGLPVKSSWKATIKTRWTRKSKSTVPCNIKTIDDFSILSKTQAAIKTRWPRKSKSINHWNIKNVVRFFNCFIDSHNVYIILELCQNWSMMDLLKRRRRIETKFDIHHILEGRYLTSFEYMMNVEFRQEYHPSRPEIRKSISGR